MHACFACLFSLSIAFIYIYIFFSKLVQALGVMIIMNGGWGEVFVMQEQYILLPGQYSADAKGSAAQPLLFALIHKRANGQNRLNSRKMD